jgi:hypothetical protein
MQVLKFASEFRDVCRSTRAPWDVGPNRERMARCRIVFMANRKRPGQFHEARNRTCVSRKSRLTLSLDDARATLIDMARLWLRLAKEQESSYSAAL